MQKLSFIKVFAQLFQNSMRDIQSTILTLAENTCQKCQAGTKINPKTAEYGSELWLNTKMSLCPLLS